VRQHAGGTPLPSPARIPATAQRTRTTRTACLRTVHHLPPAPHTIHTYTHTRYHLPAVLPLPTVLPGSYTRLYLPRGYYSAFHHGPALPTTTYLAAATFRLPCHTPYRAGLPHCRAACCPARCLPLCFAAAPCRAVARCARGVVCIDLLCQCFR